MDLCVLSTRMRWDHPVREITIGNNIPGVRSRSLRKHNRECINYFIGTKSLTSSLVKRAVFWLSLRGTCAGGGGGGIMRGLVTM